MKLDRLKNTKRNVIFGVVLQLYSIILPFIFRTVIINTLGVKYLGVSGLFASVLQVLSLAELGVGNAMIYTMYKPISEDDSDKICALMKLYKIYYVTIGWVIFGIGLAITPLIPRLVKGEVPSDLNLYILYYLNLLITVLSYWVFSYRQSILQAHQRQDVISKVTIISDSIRYGLQLFVLYVFKNYYLYVIVMLFTTALNNVITAIVSKKMYPNYNPAGELDKEEKDKINQRIKDLFTSKLGGVIVNSADSIVVSAFLGLELLAIYQNYYYILSSIMAFITIINSSVLAGIGNSMLVKNDDDNYEDFSLFVFIEFWIISFCVCCFSVMYQPFMVIWMGEELLFEYPVVILFCIYFIVTEYVQLLSVYKNAAGKWHEDRFRPLISGLFNLALNLFMVNYIGIYGILLSTIISVCVISAPWITKNIFDTIFKKESIYSYVLTVLKYLIVLLFTCIVTNYITSFIPNVGIMCFIIKTIVCVVCANVILLAFNFKNEMLGRCFDLVKRLLKIG